MPHRDRVSLVDILEAAKLIQSFAYGTTKSSFEQDDQLQSAIVRQFEIIGEATKRLSEDFKLGHSEIPWKAMAGMRDILIHAYDKVDVDEIWNATKNSVPKLIAKIEAILDKP